MEEAGAAGGEVVRGEGKRALGKGFKLVRYFTPKMGWAWVETCTQLGKKH